MKLGCNGGTAVFGPQLLRLRTLIPKRDHDYGVNGLRENSNFNFQTVVEPEFINSFLIRQAMSVPEILK